MVRFNHYLPFDKLLSSNDHQVTFGHIFWHSISHSIWPFYLNLTYILPFYLAFYLTYYDILSDICSEIFGFASFYWQIKNKDIYNNGVKIQMTHWPKGIAESTQMSYVELQASFASRFWRLFPVKHGSPSSRHRLGREKGHALEIGMDWAWNSMII